MYVYIAMVMLCSLVIKYEHKINVIFLAFTSGTTYSIVLTRD